MDTNNSEGSADLRNYFADEESMLLFALIHLDGEIRMKLLGIDPDLYESEEKAKRWRADLMKKIHPDQCRHPDAAKATAKLNKIYGRMIKNASR